MRLITVVACTVAALQPISAQVRRIPSSADRPKDGVAISLQVGAERYDFTGQGTCEYGAEGSIYDTPAQSWMVQQSDGGRSLALVFWRPVNKSADMMSLNVSTGKTSHDVDTVKGPGRTAKGSGSVVLAPSGKGGTLTINATASGGAKISGTVKCDAFTPRVAVAGD
jgi:hypothetical protein